MESLCLLVFCKYHVNFLLFPRKLATNEDLRQGVFELY